MLLFTQVKSSLAAKIGSGCSRCVVACGVRKRLEEWGVEWSVRFVNVVACGSRRSRWCGKCGFKPSKFLGHRCLPGSCLAMMTKIYDESSKFFTIGITKPLIGQIFVFSNMIGCFPACKTSKAPPLYTCSRGLHVIHDNNFAKHSSRDALYTAKDYKHGK